MPPDNRSEQEILDENEALKLELRLLGRDPARFDGLLPHEANLRLKSSLAYAEQAREAELLGQEPPPSFLDPMSSHWIPDVEDMVHYRASDLLGRDAAPPDPEGLSDTEVEYWLHWIIDRLAERGIGLAIHETVPERLAYAYLLEELAEGIDAMPIPGTFLDGCGGWCEGCFQSPYCPAAADLSKEYHFEVPAPSLPPRPVDEEGKLIRGRSYGRGLQ